jgi:hypothetical protein
MKTVASLTTLSGEDACSYLSTIPRAAQLPVAFRLGAEDDLSHTFRRAPQPHLFSVGPDFLAIGGSCSMFVSP